MRPSTLEKEWSKRANCWSKAFSFHEILLGCSELVSSSSFLNYVTVEEDIQDEDSQILDEQHYEEQLGGTEEEMDKNPESDEALNQRKRPQGPQSMPERTKGQVIPMKIS